MSTLRKNNGGDVPPADPVKMLGRLRELVAMNSSAASLAQAKTMAEDSVTPVRLMIEYIKEAVGCEEPLACETARIFYDEIIKNGDRQRAMIMADAMFLGQGVFGDYLANDEGELINQWWQDVITPKYRKLTVPEQLVLLEMAIRDCRHDEEFKLIILLVKEVSLPDDSQSRAFAISIRHELWGRWLEGSLSKNIWIPTLAAFKALVQKEMNL